jgi:hypothetical protein
MFFDSINDIHPRLRSVIQRVFPNLLNRNLIPHEIKIVDNPITRNKETIAITPQLRLRGDPLDMARVPNEGSLEYIIDTLCTSVVPLTCPNCKMVSYAHTNYITEKHSVLYCNGCSKFSWKKPIKDMSF